MKRPATEEIREEERRARYLRTLVDLASNLIMQGQLTRLEAERMAEAVRRKALELFPGKESVYELVYRPRFERLIDEFARERGSVLPFRRPPPNREG